MLPRLCDGKANGTSSLTYLSLGSNLGDREGSLRSALASLGTHGAIEVVRLSSLYETAPQDVGDQPWFLNMAAAIATSMPPFELLSLLQSIERAGGRDREGSPRRGPRTLDIDILLSSSLVMKTRELTIPHPRLTTRRFVLQPLLEIAPDLVHPVTGIALRAYLSAVKDQPLHPFCLR